MPDAAPRPTVLMELRGRDLAIVPPAEWWALSEDDLLGALFEPTDAAGAALLLARDRRGRCLRARPLHFERLRDALLTHAAADVRVAFDQHPVLPRQPELQVTARPYQDEALIAWRAAGCRGVVVLP